MDHLNHHEESAVDKIIREAMEAGEFDNLPGKGKPLQIEEDPFEDPAMWAANHLLRNSGFAPPIIMERKEIEDEIDTARASLLRSWRWYRDTPPGDWVDDQWVRAQARFRESIEDINKRIRTYNLKVKSHQIHLHTLNVDKEIERVKSWG